MKAIRLDAPSLARKNGFMDGEAVDLFVWHLTDGTEAVPSLEDRVNALDGLGGPVDDHEDERHEGGHRILIAAVHRHLLPLLPGVQVFDFVSGHNPVRATRDWAEHCLNSAVSVEIGEAEILAIITDMEAEAGISSPAATQETPQPG